MVTVPIVIWIMISYFFHADGLEVGADRQATRWRFSLSRAAIARPGITVAFILAVIFSWSNFVFGIVLAGRALLQLPSTTRFHSTS